MLSSELSVEVPFGGLCLGQVEVMSSLSVWEQLWCPFGEVQNSRTLCGGSLLQSLNITRGIFRVTSEDGY